MGKYRITWPVNCQKLSRVYCGSFSNLGCREDSGPENLCNHACWTPRSFNIAEKSFRSLCSFANTIFRPVDLGVIIRLNHCNYAALFQFPSQTSLNLFSTFEILWTSNILNATIIVVIKIFSMISADMFTSKFVSKIRALVINILSVYCTHK